MSEIVGDINPSTAAKSGERALWWEYKIDGIEASFHFVCPAGGKKYTNDHLILRNRRGEHPVTEVIKVGDYTKTLAKLAKVAGDQVKTRIKADREKKKQEDATRAEAHKQQIKDMEKIFECLLEGTQLEVAEPEIDQPDDYALLREEEAARWM